MRCTPQSLVYRFQITPGVIGLTQHVLHFAANCRQPWAVEAMTKDDAVLAAAADDEEPQEIPGALKPLMQGAWLVSAVAAFAAAAKLLS